MIACMHKLFPIICIFLLSFQDNEDTYNTIPEPLAMENAKNGLLSSEGRVFDSSEEVLSAEKGYSQLP